MGGQQAQIHPSAIIERGATIGSGAVIGPMCQIGAGATIEAGAVLMSHVVVSGQTTIGSRTVVHPFAVLGGPPQHMHYRGEPTKLIIGEDVIIREHVTMNLGTVNGKGVTTVGDRGFFMTGAHVGHDCTVGGDVIFANNATLGGHVKIADHAFLGGLCAVHQNCRIGAYAFIGGCAAVVCDVIPYASAFGNHARLAGLNVIGMKRRGMNRAAIHNLRTVYRLLFEGDGVFKDRVEQVRKEHSDGEGVVHILDFIDDGASRSLMTAPRS